MVRKRGFEITSVRWYKNLVDADGQGLDFLVPINRIVSALVKNGDKNVVDLATVS